MKTVLFGAICAGAGAIASLPSVALAGSFDAQGNFSYDPAAVATADFSTEPARYVPPGYAAGCTPPAFTIVAGKDALDSGHYVKLKVDQQDQCAERFVVTLPKKKGSYVARVWMRHGAVDAAFFAVYDPSTGLGNMSALMAPTGRATSDGWVELASNEFPIDGTLSPITYLRVNDYNDVDGVDIDALEVVPSGDFVAPATCDGVGDSACSSEQVCIYGTCALARLAVGPLPDPAIQGPMIDALEGRLNIFFGGKLSRALYLPQAIETLEVARTATTGWGFWGGIANAIHQLHDWHTDTFGGLDIFESPKGDLNACFIEGVADASHATWPSDPMFADVLVAYTGPTGSTAGLQAGDRLVAIDGQHPLAWAASLTASDWDYHIATDPEVFADLAEMLGGTYFTGGQLILKYAHSITVVRCNPADGTCSDTPENIDVATLLQAPAGRDVACDNRPLYHLGANGPDPTSHFVFNHIYTGAIDGTTPDEAIFGMVWDTLDGGGSQTSPVNMQILAANADWTMNAHGVILDHRAGNGGTLDSATNVTRLVRPPSIAAALMIPMEVEADNGVTDTADGLARFARFSAISLQQYQVGDEGWAQKLPVALITHRDGSASDYMPLGMKGAPNVRIFGPHQTAGAFSTFIDFALWGENTIQFASGDTIAPDGSPLLGHGVQPDVVMLPKQSDLMAGHDTLFDAALAWLRSEANKQ